MTGEKINVTVRCVKSGDLGWLVYYIMPDGSVGTWFCPR
jgi:hypothetical protein